MSKIALFVDVQNIYYTTRDVFGKNFDYNALWAHLSDKHQITLAKAYAIASTNPKQRQFHHILRGIGFDVQLKPFIQRSDGSAKGDWDVGITIDIMEAIKDRYIERVVLLSGDGDFDRLATHVCEQYGKAFEVISVRKLTAQSLIDACSHYSEIDTHFLL